MEDPISQLLDAVTSYTENRRRVRTILREVPRAASAEKLVRAADACVSDWLREAADVMGQAEAADCLNLQSALNSGGVTGAGGRSSGLEL